MLEHRQWLTGPGLFRLPGCGSIRSSRDNCQIWFARSRLEFCSCYLTPEKPWPCLSYRAQPNDPVRIEANILSDPDDLKAAIACVEQLREVANSVPLRPFVKREVMPGDLKGRELETFVRDTATAFWHETCTAKMGRDEMSIVDGRLKVYGVDNLRIADGSIMPRITTTNTMAPCVIIGERAAEALQSDHRVRHFSLTSRHF